MIEALYAVDPARREAFERANAQRLERARQEKAERERERLETLEVERAHAKAAREQVQSERAQTEHAAERAELDEQAERRRNEQALATQSNERFLIERSRIEGPLAYQAQAERVAPYQRFELSQLDRLQTLKLQSARQWLQHYERAAIDRIELSDGALLQLALPL